MRGRFFIVGTGRCGSGLLRKMLILHPNVNICDESHFLRALYDSYGLDPITFEEYFSVMDDHYHYKAGGPKWIQSLLESEGKSYDNFEEDFAEFCRNTESGTIVDYTERLYEYLYGEGDYLVGHKSVHYGTFMTILKEMWPNARFIHLLRDGVHASCSMTKHRGFIRLINADVSPSDLVLCSYKGRIRDYSSRPVKIEDAASFWESVLLKTLEEAKAISKNDYYEVKYEDLIRDPVQSLVNISRFLDIIPYRKWLKRASLEPRPFSLNSAKYRMSKEEYQNLAASIWETMQLLGYPLDNRYYSIANPKEFWRIVRKILSKFRWQVYAKYHETN